MKFYVCLLLIGACASIDALSLDNSKKNLLPSKDVCGIEVCDNVFPWLVFIPLQSRVFNPSADLRCAGALINKRYVITNKSCLQFVLNEVHLGCYDTTKDVTCKGNPIKIIKVGRKVVSESYDAVLLRLDEDVEYTDEIKPICLPFEEFKRAKVADEVLTSGWGLVHHSGHQRAHVMKKVAATVVASDQCSSSSDVTKPICVKQNDGNKDNLCNGDEGSPIMYKSGKHWVMEGILTWLFGRLDVPCSIDTPARGFKITEEVLEWIVEKIEE